MLCTVLYWLNGQMLKERNKCTTLIFKFSLLPECNPLFFTNSHMYRWSDSLRRILPFNPMSSGCSNVVEPMDAGLIAEVPSSLDDRPHYRGHTTCEARRFLFFIVYWIVSSVHGCQMTFKYNKRTLTHNLLLYRTVVIHARRVRVLRT